MDDLLIYLQYVKGFDITQSSNRYNLKKCFNELQEYGVYQKHLEENIESLKDENLSDKLRTKLKKEQLTIKNKLKEIKNTLKKKLNETKELSMESIQKQNIEHIFISFKNANEIDKLKKLTQELKVILT